MKHAPSELDAIYYQHRGTDCIRDYAAQFNLFTLILIYQSLHMVSCHGCHAHCSRPTCDRSRMVRLHIRSWIFWHSPIRTICWKVNLPRPLSITSTNTLFNACVHRHLRSMNLGMTHHCYASISHDVDRVVLLCYWSPTIVVGLLPSRSMSGPTMDQDGPFWWGA